MFKLFKRKKGKVAAAHIMWNHVGRWIDIRQQRYANWLQAKTKTLSTKAVIIIFLIFFLMVAGYSSCIIYQAIYH